MNRWRNIRTSLTWRNLWRRITIGRYHWTPFDKNGYLDHDRLQREGWTVMGAMKEDDEK